MSASDYSRFDKSDSVDVAKAKSRRRSLRINREKVDWFPVVTACDLVMSSLLTLAGSA